MFQVGLIIEGMKLKKTVKKCAYSDYVVALKIMIIWVNRSIIWIEYDHVSGVKFYWIYETKEHKKYASFFEYA